MEKYLKIKTSDNKIIEAIQRGSNNKHLIVLVHGLCGNMNEAMHYNAARYFEKNGFSSLRFNLYSWNKRSRKLHECNLKTHGKDIDTVLRYLDSKGFRKIFIVGHSYGFSSILHAKNKIFKAAVSWDGSYLPHRHFDKLNKVKKPKGRIIDEGYFVIIGEEMVKESHVVSSLQLIKDFKRPVRFIAVRGPTGNLLGAKKMFKVASKPKSLVVIENASHNFIEDRMQEKLYAETIKWFKKF